MSFASESVARGPAGCFRGGPLSRACGTYKTVKARFWPWVSCEWTFNALSRFLLARSFASEGGLMGPNRTSWHYPKLGSAETEDEFRGEG